jgi:CRP-like cAMP-binding protein
VTKDDPLDDPFDPEKLRLPERLILTPGAAAKAEQIAKRRQNQFVRFPLSWADKLRTARRTATYRVAMHLLFQCWKSNTRAVSLSNMALAAAGVSRREKWRALAELEQLGLIRVGRHPRKSPTITVLLD